MILFGEKRKRLSSTTIVSIAAVLTIGTASLWFVARNSGVAPLVRACDAMPRRVLSARLYGGFAYRPYSPIAKRGNDLGSTRGSARLALAASELSVTAQSRQTPESMYRAGVSQLITGKVDEGVLALEESILRATDAPDVLRGIELTNEPAVLTDLSAGYLARAGDEDSLDLLAAMNSAERAWEIARTPEIAWNRALSFSAASSRAAALDAWRDYLALDPASQWSAEARQRMDAVAAGGAASRDVVKRAVLAALSKSDDDALVKAVSSGPGFARVMAEEEFLPAWGRGDQTALAPARRIGAAVVRISGDFMVADTVAKIDAMSEFQRSQARMALVCFQEGRQKMSAFEYAESLTPLKDAEVRLKALGVPLAARLQMWEATSIYQVKQADDQAKQADYQAKQAEASVALCADVLRRADISRYPSVTEQCQWNDALIDTGLRNYDGAKAGYESARALALQMGDVAAAASIDVRLQENERLTGDVAMAWSHMSRSLRTGAPRPNYFAMGEAARMAEAAGMPFAALAFYECGIDAARTPAENAHGRVSRARLKWKMGREDEARIDLNAATRFAHAVHDPATAAMLDPYVAIARATLTVAARPDEIVQQLDHTVNELLALGNRREIAHARCLQAQARIARHDPAAAERSLQLALNDIEAQREQISTDEERLALVDTAREATEVLVGLLYDANRPTDALLAAESSKARLLLDAIGARETKQSVEPPSRPESDEAFIEYFALPDRLLVWTVTARGTRAHVIAAGRSKLEKQIDAWQRALSDGDEQRVRSRGAELSKLLLEPIWPDAGSFKRLVFAADGALTRLPFVALIAPSSGAFLVDDHEIVSVPSLAWLAAERRLPAAPLQFTHVVATVPSANAGNAGHQYARLPEAEQDVRAIAARFPGTTVLTGEEATGSRIATATLGADLFHFSGHAVIDDRRPGRSALVMTGGELLRAVDVAQWRLPHTRLVVLAACSTGAGRPTSDGTASLSRAFLIAGAQSAVATLWPIDDAAASELSRHFYAALSSGSSPREALRAAQRFLIHSPRSPSQYDWAAFQFIGS